MSWLCSCGTLNSGLNEDCAASKQTHLEIGKVEHKQVTANSPDFVMATAAVRELRIDMTQPEELFAKFYNHEKILVKDMDLIQLRDHRDELSKIAFEAKARLRAAEDEHKERKAKTANKEWLVTDTKPSPNVSDAINAVKQRAARMSKMDKIREGLLKSGIDEQTVNEMVRTLEKKATDSKLKTITFTKPSTEIGAVQVKADGEEKKPFDPSALKFGS